MTTLRNAKVVAYLIALIAGVMSYGHQIDLLLLADLGYYAYAVPLTVDLLAFIGAMVRNSDVASEGTRRAALVPLTLAGSMAVAANVAVAHNVVQIVVGVWTVAAYLIAETFVSRLKAKPTPVVEVDDEERAKRSAAARKGAETKRRKRAAAAKTARKPHAPKDSADAARMLAAAGVAPVSPA
jgi:hypothetical protein